MRYDDYLDVYQILVEDMITVLTDMTTILVVTKVEKLEMTIEHMVGILPNLRKVPAATKLEVLQKTIQNMVATTPDFTSTSISTAENELHEIIQNMIDTTTNMIGIFDINNGEGLQKIVKNLAPMIPQMTGLFSKIAWEQFEPTDEDIKEAQRILQNEDIGKVFADFFTEKQSDKELNNSFKIILLVVILLYHTIGFINDSAVMTVKELTHERIIPIVDFVKKENQRTNIETENKVAKQLTRVLKQEIPTEIISFFLICIKSDLTVHQNPKVSSRIIGRVGSTDVVQFIEKRGDWVRVFYDDPKNCKALEGWVLKKYLKKLK